jgi:DNA-binding NarL/FixJ family response regulator
LNGDITAGAAATVNAGLLLRIMGVIPSDTHAFRSAAEQVAVRVLVVSGVRLVRDALVSVLARCDGIVVSAPVSMVADAAAAVAGDNAIILIESPLIRSLEAMQALQASVPRARLVAFAVNDADNDIVACAEAGLAGYVLNDDSLEDLLTTVRRVARGEWSVSPRAGGMLFRHVGALAAQRAQATRPGIGAPRLSQPSQSTEFADRLTAREDEVLRLVESGHSNKEIARRLHIEVTTVKNHVHHILGKLGVTRRGQAAKVARDGPSTVTEPR